MGASRDPSPISPSTIRSTADQLPDEGVSADSIRSAAEQLPEAPSIDPDSIRSVAERLPGQSAPEDTGFMDQLAGIALAANPANVTRTVAEDIGETYQEEGLSGIAEEAGGAVQDVLSQAGKQFFRGRSQEALDRARFMLSEETSAATEPRRRVAPSTNAAPLQGEAVQAAARDAVQRAEELSDRAESFEGAPAVQEVSRQMQQGDFAGAFQTMQEQPSFLPALGIGTMAQQPAALAATSGLMAGAGALAPAGLATTLATGAAGAGGSFLTADIVEGRAELAKSLREAGADVSDTDDVLTKLQDPGFRREVEERVDTRVASIGTVDALANLATMGMASSGMARPVTALLGAGGEIAAEGAGEATAQYATRGEISPADVALESLAGVFGPATVEAGTQVAASGDGEAAQARQTGELVDRIRQRAQEVQGRPQPGPAEEAEARPQRPLADMDDQALESAREEALANKDTDTAELIDEELSLREQDSGSQEQAQPDQAGPRAGTPSPLAEQEASLRALEAVEQARQNMRRRDQARRELGLGQVPEDPAPDVDARIDNTDSDGQERVPEQPGREEGDGGGQEDAQDEPRDPDAGEGKGATRPAGRPEDEGGRQVEAGAQGELDEEMGLRPDTRPEEQVDEAVEAARERVRSAEEQLRETEQQIQSALEGSDPDTIARLAKQTSSDRVAQQLEAELARRQEQAGMFDEGAQQQGGSSGDLFGGGAAESTAGLERIVRRLEQREAGLEQAREELLRRERQQPEARQEAREAQQDLSIPESDEVQGEGTNVDVAPEEAQEMETPRLIDVAEEAAANDNADQEQVILDELQRRREAAQAAGAEYTPPAGPSPGSLLLEGTGEGQPLVEATVTEEAVQAPEGTAPATLRRLADEAARHDKALETPPAVSQQSAQALYQLAQEGYEVTRAPSATQSGAGVAADGEAAFRVRAPRLDQTRPTTETSGVTVGRAAQTVTRETAQNPRSDAFSDADTAQLREQLEEAASAENEQAVRRLQEEINRRENPPTQTTYRHREGDLVVVAEDGTFLDARSGERYYEAVADYFAAHEQELRQGVVEPRTNEGDYARTVARSSSSPQQVLEVYNTQRARGEEGQDPVTDMMDATRYSTASFDEYADPNWRQDNGQLTMEWLGGDKSLDARAQEITEATGQETTPQDIVEHITENPQGPGRRSAAERLRDDLAQRFEELTGISLTPDLASRIQSEQIESLTGREAEGATGESGPFTPRGDAPFQRMADQGGRRSAGRLVEVYLRKIAANLGAPVTVARAPSDLEGRAAEAYERGRRRAGQDFSQPAMFFDGQVYVIASDLEANARAMGRDLETFARQTVMHEVVAHKGLRELLGGEFAATMDALFESIGRGRLLSAQTADGTPLADAYAPELETSEDGTLTPESRQLLVEEYLARLAEDMAAPESVVQTIYRRVRDALRRLFGTRITEADLRLLLEASRDHLRAEQERNPVSSTRFSRQASKSVPAARWMMVGSRATGFDQAQEEGRTFQGLDEDVRFEISDAEAQFAEDGPLWNFVTGARKAKHFTGRLESSDDPSEDVAEQAEQAQKKRTVAQASLEEGARLEDVITHDRLFEQYPDLREVVLEARPMEPGAQASYNPAIDTITLNLRRVEKATEGDMRQAATVLEDALQSVLHEIQHAVQQIEGFSQGDSPNRRIYQAKQELDTSQGVFRRFLRARDALSVARMVENTGRDLEAAIEEQVTLAESDRARTMPVDTDLVRQIVEEETPASIQDTMKALRTELEDVGFNPNDPGDQQALQREEGAAQRWQQRRAYNLYRRASGEVEARLTAERREVPREERITETGELRRAVDYDPEEVIVRYSRQQGAPNQLGLFHDPESGDSEVTGGSRTMVTLHNLDPQNVRFAVHQMDGYLPVPSLATVRYEDGFSSFGDITLLGDPDLVDPETGDSTPTFAGDAYTPTTPGAAYEGDVDAWLESDVQEQVEKWSGVLGRSDASGIYSYVQSGERGRFYSMMTRAPAALMAFREAQGEQILARDLPRRSYDGFMSDYLLQDSLTSFLDGLSDAELNRLPYAVVKNNEAHDPQLAEDLTAALKDAVQEHATENFSGPPERRQEKAEVLAGAHLSEDGRPSFNTLDRLRRSYRSYKNQDEQPVDTSRVREESKTRVQEHTGADSWREAREEMEAYWRERVDPFSEPRMPSDTSKPYNLYNIVERMRERGIRAAEGSGVNFLRALAIEQFGTLEEVQAMRDRLTSREEYKQAAARLEEDFGRLWENLKPSHQAFDQPDITPRRRLLQQAIADYVPRRSTFEEARSALNRSGFASVPAEDVQAFMSFVEDLRSEPVQYFESKPQRAVALKEFQAAIVPSDVPSDVREQLGETVGRVAEYEAGSDADRQETLTEESARAGVRFQRQRTDEEAATADSDVPPNPNAFTQDWSIENLKALARREWRRWFEQRSLLPESVWKAKMERDGALAAGMERVRYALRDFGRALEQAYDTQSPSPETARRLNEALQNGYRANINPEQAELFASDSEPVAAQEAPAGVVTTSDGNQIEMFGAAPPTSPAVTAPERQTLADMTFIEDLPGESSPEGGPSEKSISVREAVSTLRDHIDALTALGLKAGLWKGELRTVVTENLGTYVTRSYKVHHEPDYGDTVKQAVREHASEDLELDPDNVPESLGVEADTWNRAVQAMRNLHPGMSDERVLGELFGLLTTDEEGGLYQGGSKLGSVGQSIYERRKDIPVPLRDLMGEYKEPGQNYLRSMNKMLRAVTSQKFLNQVKQAGLGEWLRREPTVEDGTEYTEEIAAEGSRTMAPLNGLYTTKEIKQAFETFDQPATLNKAYRWYMRAAGTVKEMLTKYSVKLQVRNLTSAFGFGMSQGHMFDENYLDAYATAFPASFNRVFQQEDSEAQRELTQKLLRLQVLDEAPRIGDIEETWRDAGAMMKDPLGDGIDTVWEKYYRQADQYATRAYQAGDNVHKIAGFLIEKARYADAYPNRSEQEVEEIAARRVRNTFPTYSLVPKGIRRLRRNPLASSFPSFFAEIVRNRANTLRLIKEEMKDPRTRPIAIKRAAGEMVNASIWAGIAAGGMALAGVDDEFDDYFRRHLPSWEKYSYLFYYPSEEGKQSFVDIGYLNPNATFHEPVLAALGGEEVDEKSAAATAAYRFLAPFVSPEILTQSVAEAAFNESYESGGPIYNPELPPAEKAEEAAKHIGQNFTPGVLEQANDIRQAFAADQEGYGEDAPTKLEALASTFLGQSMRTVEADNSWKWKTINLQSQYRDAGSIWYQALTERGSTSRSRLEERYRTSLKRKQELVQKAHKDLIGAELMGLPEQEAYTIMDAQGASDALKADVMAGRFRPRPDFNILSGRIQSERQSGNDEDADRLQERAEVAREIMQEVSQEFRRPNDEDAARSTSQRLSNSVPTQQ